MAVVKGIQSRLTVASLDRDLHGAARARGLDGPNGELHGQNLVRTHRAKWELWQPHSQKDLGILATHGERHGSISRSMLYSEQQPKLPLPSRQCSYLSIYLQQNSFFRGFG
jgi:hypothetical protein